MARILLQQFWKKEVKFLKAEEGYIQHIKGATAGVIIGDRALAARSSFPFIYDLAGAWKQHTGRPFVFATWIANKPMPAVFMEAFDNANAFGLAHLNDVISAIPASEQVYDLHTYYTQNISYSFTLEKKAGMKLFLESL